MTDPVGDMANHVEGGLKNGFNKVKSVVGSTISVAGTAAKIAAPIGLLLIAGDATAMAEIANNAKTVAETADFSELIKTTLGNAFNMLSTAYSGFGDSVTPEILSESVSNSWDWTKDIFSTPDIT